MFSDMIGRIMGTSQSSQNEPAAQPADVGNDRNESEGAQKHKPENVNVRNEIVKEIANMIMNGRRNSTDDWIEFVYSFASRVCGDLRRDAATDEAFSDRTTLQERVRKVGASMIKADPTDPQLQRLREMSLFSIEPEVEDDDPVSKEDEGHSPRAHPLAGSSVAQTFQWRNSIASLESTAKSRNRTAWDIPDVEFTENSAERNAVLKAIIKLLSTKRCNSTENWHRACPQLATRLEGMLYKHASNLDVYSDLSTVTERVLQFVTLGGFKKPFQVKVVRHAEPLETFVVPPAVLPKITAPYSGTIDDPAPSKRAFASPKKPTTPSTGKKIAEAPPLSESKQRGRPRKPSSEAPEPLAVSTKPPAVTTSSAEKPLSPAPKDLLQRQQQRLLLLQHVARCNHDDTEGPCPVTPHCASMKALWQHVQQCSLVKCPTPHCVSSRYVLSHWCNCADPACRMCQPARQDSDAHLKRMTAEEAAAKSTSAASQAQAASSSSEQASSVRKRKPTTQWEEEDISSQSKKKAKEHGPTGAKENVVNFGDLSSPQAKRRLSAADKAYRSGRGGERGGDGGSVHSAYSGVSLHSHNSQHSRHSAVSNLSRGSSHHSPRGAGSSNTAQWIQRLFLPVIEELLAVPGAELVFGQPVDPAALHLPNYFDVIKHPMDLGTVRQTLQMRHYKDVQDLLSDVQQTFTNALLYNRVGSEVYNLAKKLRMLFNEKSRKPRFELSAKLQELSVQREARVAQPLASTSTSTSSTAPASASFKTTVAVFHDAPEVDNENHQETQQGSVLEERPGKSISMTSVEGVREGPDTGHTGHLYVRNLTIAIP